MFEVQQDYAWEDFTITTNNPWTVHEDKERMSGHTKW